MEKKTDSSEMLGRVCGQVQRSELSSEISRDISFEELRNKFDTSASLRREIASKPSTHGSATRQLVSGKVFKKCKSATFQIDGATYTIGKYLCLGLVKASFK
ncbi:unnamed protein product [Leptosia nina]|uniref:Uncharacterized protein n=1 Tax=Leptosia nina TaxID=320188 RepID=A0AAV1J6U1_9NEOP